MSSKSKKKHWTHQQGIAHQLSSKYDAPRDTHWVVFEGDTPGVYGNYATTMEKSEQGKRKVKGYPSEGAAIEAFTRHFLKKVNK